MNTKNLLARLPVAVFVTVAVLYGGAKPSGSTNEPPARLGARLMSPPPAAASIPEWGLRGAWTDWKRITFPGGWRFPIGTNFIRAATLMSGGSIREALQGTASGRDLVSLPVPLALEPGVSSVTYGLTASNSLLFAWTDACVDRDPTNRVNATLELFRSGAVAMTVTPLSASRPPISSCCPPVPPEGFVGRDQDADWATNAFPAAAAAIAEKGYDRWLEEDCVGINEQNGLYRALVTVPTMPPDGEPCYLVCGSYKVVVTHPGTYGFPLEVFETYVARTYPTTMPLEIETDDGYRVNANEEPPANDAPLRLGAAVPVSNIYNIREYPRLVVTPSRIPLNEAVGTRLSIWCNIKIEARGFCRFVGNAARIIWRGYNEAEILEAICEEQFQCVMDEIRGSCSESVTIYSLLPTHCVCGSLCECPNACVCRGGDKTCFCCCEDCQGDGGSTTNRYCTGLCP